LSRRGLHGFATLRTRPPVPVEPALLVPKHRCTKCGAVLGRRNRTDTCSACSLGHIEIPDWAAELIAFDDHPHTVSTVASVIMDKPRNHYKQINDVDEIVALRAQGMSAYAIARETCHNRTTVVDVLRRVDRDKGEA
jgi:hypothetical protein